MRRLLAAMVVASVLVAPIARAPAGEPAVVVIVHPSRTEKLGEAEIERIYLARRRFWDDGGAVVALNLPAGTALREHFSRRVLHRDSAELASYWNEQYFQGVFPPSVLASSDAVKRYVADDPHAIGYVDAAAVDDSVRVVFRFE